MNSAKFPGNTKLLLRVGICPVPLERTNFPVVLFICIMFEGIVFKVVNTLFAGLLGTIFTMVFLACGEITVPDALLWTRLPPFGRAARVIPVLVFTKVTTCCWTPPAFWIMFPPCLTSSCLPVTCGVACLMIVLVVP